MKNFQIQKRIYCCIFCLISTLNACAQTLPYGKESAWLNEFKTAEQSTVLLNNQSSFLPLTDLQNKKIASVAMGVRQAVVFDSMANQYTTVARFSSMDPVSENLSGLNKSLERYNTLIIQLTDASLNEPAVVPFIMENQKNKQVVVVLYGDEQSLSKLDSLSIPIIWNRKETDVTANFIAQAIFGGVAISAKLPQTASVNHKQGDGFTTNITRLNYTVPESVGISTEDLEKPIDVIVQEAISQRATPGAVVLVAKDGKVIFNKAYGYHTFENLTPDKATDIFDLASVTKIAATTMAVMRLYEQDKLNLDANVGNYLAEARNTNKNTIPVRDLMLHQAGLVPYIPFYQNITPEDCSRDSTGRCCVKVSDNYYLRKGYYQDIMWSKMLHSRLETPGKYVYSDLSMYIMKEIVEHQATQSLSSYVCNEFYKPLGMQTAGFNPRNRFEREQIVPTEDDDYFRMARLQGFVHDQGAAMAGGVSGHAGLFSNANDMAILFQMMLNKGNYGGSHYFKPETVELFTARQSNASRRGLGFDRWDPERSKKYPSELASPQTYGHTGFTGTCVWVDPKYNLIYVFLSNRIHAKGGNKLSSLSIRPRIQDAIYQAILKSNKVKLTKN